MQHRQLQKYHRATLLFIIFHTDFLFFGILPRKKLLRLHFFLEL